MNWAEPFEIIATAIRKKQAVVYGRNGKFLKLIVDFSIKLRIELFCVLAISSALLTRILFKSWMVPIAVVEDNFSYVFVGCGSRVDTSLYRDYCDEIHQEACFVRDDIVASFFGFQKVGVIDSFRKLYQEIHLANSQLSDIAHEFQPWRNDFYVDLARGLAHYIYFRCWFEKAHGNQRIKEVAFVAWGYASYAAKDAGLKTCFIQHGLLYAKPKLSGFDRVVAITEDEAHAIQHILPEARVNLKQLSYVVSDPSFQRRSIVVASGNYNALQRKGVPIEMLNLIEYFLGKGYSVLVKPYVGEKIDYWLNSPVCSRISLCDAGKDFEHLLEDTAPRFVVSIGSTCLASALRSNIIPIRINHPEHPDYLSDYLYPLARRSLNYPNDIEIIDQLMDDNDLYIYKLSRLRSL